MGATNQFKYTLLPSHDKPIPYFVISFQKFALCTASLALFGFVFCIVWSIAYNFEETTKTHCDVFNFLPSISAAIGSYAPQKYVWRISIFTHVIPRFFIPVLYTRYYYEILQKRVHKYANITVFLNFLELLALTGLTNWSSNDNYRKYVLPSVSLLFLFHSRPFGIICVVS